EVQLEVGAELQPPVRMRDRHRAHDVPRDALRGRVRNVVDREDDAVVAHASPAVRAPIAPEGRLAQIDCHAHHLFVFTLCTWRYSPSRIGAIVRPMSTP